MDNNFEEQSGKRFPELIMGSGDNSQKLDEAKDYLSQMVCGEAFKCYDYILTELNPDKETKNEVLEGLLQIAEKNEGTIASKLRDYICQNFEEEEDVEEGVCKTIIDIVNKKNYTIILSKIKNWLHNNKRSVVLALTGSMFMFIIGGFTVYGFLKNEEIYGPNKFAPLFEDVQGTTKESGTTELLLTDKVQNLGINDYQKRTKLAEEKETIETIVKGNLAINKQYELYIEGLKRVIETLTNQQADIIKRIEKEKGDIQNKAEEYRKLYEKSEQEKEGISRERNNAVTDYISALGTVDQLQTVTDNLTSENTKIKKQHSILCEKWKELEEEMVRLQFDESNEALKYKGLYEKSEQDKTELQKRLKIEERKNKLFINAINAGK